MNTARRMMLGLLAGLVALILALGLASPASAGGWDPDNPSPSPSATADPDDAEVLNAPAVPVADQSTWVSTSIGIDDDGTVNPAPGYGDPKCSDLPSTGASATEVEACNATADGAVNINPKHWWLIIKNDSKTNMPVCREWGKATDLWHCNPKYGIRYLKPGERTDTAFGWKDTDGVWIYSHTQLKRNQPGANPVLGQSMQNYGVMLKMSPRISSYNRGDVMGLYYKHI